MDMRTGSLAAAIALGACSSASLTPPSPIADAGAACASLNAPIPAAAIALPTRGAVIESATLHGPSAEAATDPLPFVPPPPEAVIVPATPEHCRVVGRIEPVDPEAPSIRFQVNLPSQWNGRSLQLGGGGFNGVLVTGLALPPDARIDLPGPLARGFATVGTDSGHQNAQGVALQAFALNDEALENFAHAAYKKVRDVSVELMRRRYGQDPRKLYFMGSSEGGREGLTMAQRYPKDFDGIFSRVPVIHWTGLQAAGTRMGETQMGPGWLSPAHVKLIGAAVLAQCDRLDALADGIVGNPEACRGTVDLTPLRCANGAAGEGCLSDAQLGAWRTLHAPYDFPFALANGVTRYPGWGYGGEAATGTGPVGGYVSWQTGTAPQTLPASPQSSRAWLYGSGAVQYFFIGDAQADPRRFDPSRHAERVRRISSLMDSTDPDLSIFHARGGKLVIAEHLADYAQSPFAGIEYWRAVVARLGSAATEEFVRLYATPGADHVGTGAPVGVDMLQVLVDWVEQGRAPQQLEQVSLAASSPHAEVQSRPLCRWPAYPRYRGSGDPGKATSFDCAMP